MHFLFYYKLMIIRQIRPEEKKDFDKVVTHPLQSWEWGVFRQKTGLKVVRIGIFEGQRLVSGFQITFHKIPKTSYYIGYAPKCHAPNEAVINAFKKVGVENNCIFIKLEPNVGFSYDPNIPERPEFNQLKNFLFSQGCVYGRPLFTKYTFQIDLNKSEEDLFNNLKSKTRYNVRLALKNKVEVAEDNSQEAFEKHLELTFETAGRQKFYAHDKDYHRKMWTALQPTGMARLMKATYQGETLVSWILFKFNNVLYYPYGASSSMHRELMASNLIMWEAIRLGKRLGCSLFDLWGSLGPKPNPKDPWFGFHRFKAGYNPQLIEFIGSFDLIIKPSAYKLFNIADSLRWKMLKIKAALPF